MEKDLSKIINYYGINNQLKKLNEECYELVEAIRNLEEQKRACEFVSCSRLHINKEKEHVAEEVADCYVLLEQFIEYYKIDRFKVAEIMRQKIDRQLKRMEEKTNEIIR